MRPGDLIIVRGHNLFDRAVEDLEKSPYSHVAGIVNDTQLIQVEDFKLTSYGPISQYVGQDIYTWPDWVTDDQRMGMVAWANNHVGSHYANGILIWELIRYTTHIMLPWWVAKNHYICSEYWASAAISVGVDLWPGIKYPSPVDMATKMIYEGRV